MLLAFTTGLPPCNVGPSKAIILTVFLFFGQTAATQTSFKFKDWAPHASHFMEDFALQAHKRPS